MIPAETRCCTDLRAPPHHPIIGEKTRLASAGIHIDGLQKNKKTYLPFDIKQHLDYEIGIILTPYSGRAGIAAWLNKHMGLNVSKRDAIVQYVYDNIAGRFEKDPARSVSSHEISTLVEEFYVMRDLEKKVRGFTLSDLNATEKIIIRASGHNIELGEARAVKQWKSEELALWKGV